MANLTTCRPGSGNMEMGRQTGAIEPLSGRRCGACFSVRERGNAEPQVCVARMLC